MSAWISYRKIRLIEALDYIGSIQDKGGQIDIIYLDMSKAFLSMVDHELLTTTFAWDGNWWAIFAMVGKLPDWSPTTNYGTWRNI
jgi:hypothetical protein